MRAELTIALVLLAGCNPVRVLTQPGGDGGWSTERRRETLTARATRARVDLDPSLPAPDPDATAPLSFADVVALAARESRRIAEADRDVAIAAARVRDARGRYFPALTGQGRYNWYSDEQTTAVSFPPGLLPPGTIPPVVVVREKDYGTVGGTATVPIDLWGEIAKSLSAVQAGYRAEEARRFATLLGEQVVAVRAYFGLLEAERLRTVAEQTLAAQRQQLANAESRVAAGRITKNELLVVQVAVQTTEARLRTLDLQAAEARFALNTVVGRPIDAPTRVVDVTARPAVPTEPDALRDAYVHNPVLLALVEEQQRLEDTASALARTRLPQFQGGGAVDYTSAEVLQPQQVESAFVGFAWTFDAGGRKEAEIAEARLAADRNRIRIERSLREIESAIRTTRRAATERLAALATAETAVTQAEENLRIREQQFDVGRATSEDVLDAEALVADQRATLATALYQAHTRRAELQQAMGLPLDAILPAERSP